MVVTATGRQDASDPYETVGTAVVHDIFTETAARLAGQYLALADATPDETESGRLRERAMRLLTLKRTVPADDRAQLIAYIRLWRGELESLKGMAR
ncbi:hypothetical protein [Streptomyces orinoci]|uniref:Uncharacterized protein n=1 Tax=Streptomyces orinoci TaxID=67339 RepID=A0ABV3JUF2_STRON|nr:hypothetical protein [Streptomyces orinoci]